MKIKVLDAETLGSDLVFSKLEECGELFLYPTSTEEEILKRVEDADIIIINKIKITEKVLSASKKLKLICVAATGFDNIDLNACRQKNVAVSNVVGYSTNSVCQVTLAMVLSLSVNLNSFSDFVKDGRYQKSGVANKLTPVYHELWGKTWGIVGYGNIGRQVGRVAKALGCNVIVNKKTPSEDATCVSLDEVCKMSDIITIHTPLNDSTKMLIGKKQLSMMKDTVILVNTARGLVTDEKAIAEFIKEGRIGAFGTDVYATEPFLKDHPFNDILGYENVCLTPHMAWGSFESRTRCLDEITKNIRAFLGGQERNRVELVN